MDERQYCGFSECGVRIYQGADGKWRHHGSNMIESYAPEFHEAVPFYPADVDGEISV